MDDYPKCHCLATLAWKVDRFTSSSLYITNAAIKENDLAIKTEIGWGGWSYRATITLKIEVERVSVFNVQLMELNILQLGKTSYLGVVLRERVGSDSPNN